ncbi:MAG: hypothetical protein IJU72_07675 [Bacteroidales bacterium]|nr:hypothetical protein [Bacteroidales bacterium]
MTCNLISPEQTLSLEGVRLVQVPGTKGSFGILPRHAHLVSSLTHGQVRIVKGDSDEVLYPLPEGGFVEVKDDVVSIVAASFGEAR